MPSMESIIDQVDQKRNISTISFVPKGLQSPPIRRWVCTILFYMSKEGKPDDVWGEGESLQEALLLAAASALKTAV